MLIAAAVAAAPASTIAWMAPLVAVVSTQSTPCDDERDSAPDQEPAS